MTQEPIAQAMTAMCPLDEAGNVGDDEGLLIDADHTEIRDQRCERVVGDFGPGGADHGDQRGFSRVRQTDQTDVGDQLELDEQRTLFPGFSRLGKPRGLPCGRCEVLIPLPSPPALYDPNSLALSGEIREDLSGIFVANDRADGKLDDDVLARVARAIRSHSMLAPLRAPLGSELKVI